MIKNVKLAIIWLAPFLLGPIYASIRSLLHSLLPTTIGTPSPQSVFSVLVIEAISTPLWVAVGFLFTYLFGGIAVVYLIRAIALNKLLRKKFVISTKVRDLEISNIARHGRPSLYFGDLTKKNFLLCLALTLAINLVYTLSLQRYFAAIVTLPSSESSQYLYNYLFSQKLILSDYALAMLFLPLLAMVVPLFFGRISVRQVDASRFDLYWLSYVFSISGGASLVLFLFDVFVAKASTAYFIIALALVYGVLSWYTALGMILALPYAERRLARELMDLRDEATVNDEERRKIIFGHLYAGPSREESERV